MKRLLLSIGLISLILTGCGNAEKFGNLSVAEKQLSKMQKLSSLEIEKLLTNKSIDFHVNSNVYNLTFNDNGNVTGSGLTGTWNVKENGIRCMVTDKTSLSCINIYKNNDNVYYTTRPDKTKILSAFIVE